MAELRAGLIFELCVVMFQVFGVAALCLHRLLPTTRWAERGRVGFVVALFGLGVAGAICGGRDSEFGLFAGATMTALLIGMTIGGGLSCSSEPMLVSARVESD